MGRKRWIAWVALGIVALLGAGALASGLGGRNGPGDGAKSSLATGGADSVARSRAATGAPPLHDVATMPASGEQALPASDAPQAPKAAGGTASLGALPLPSPSTRVVKTATLSLEVKRGKLDASYGKVLDAVQVAGGFVAGTEQSHGRAQLTLRIPAAAFETTLGRLRGFGKVTDESLRGEDVTAQFTDIEARLRNLRAQEAVLLDLMRQARNIPDSITVQQQLSQIQQQVEELEGQRRVLDDQSSFGTLTVSLAVPGAAPTPRPVERSTLGNAWVRATGVALDVLAGTLVVLGALVPLAVVVGGFGLVAWAILRRRRPVAPAGHAG